MIPPRFLARLLLLAVVLIVCDAFAPEARAGLGNLFSGLGARSRVVQFCVVTMAVALFILMKKFSFHDSDRRAFAPKMNYAPFEDDSLRSGDRVTS